MNKSGLQGIGDNLFLETPSSGTAATRNTEHARLRQPAAELARASQCRGRQRNLRPDRRAARLRNERQGRVRRRPDAAIDLRHDAIRSRTDDDATCNSGRYRDRHHVRRRADTLAASDNTGVRRPRSHRRPRCGCRIGQGRHRGVSGARSRRDRQRQDRGCHRGAATARCRGRTGRAVGSVGDAGEPHDRRQRDQAPDRGNCRGTPAQSPISPISPSRSTCRRRRFISIRRSQDR